MSQQQQSATDLLKRITAKRQRTVTPCATTTDEDQKRSNTEEEVDLANCLILLAQGQAKGFIGDSPKEKFIRRKFLENPDGSQAGCYVYECKTYFRTFPSFQALGGHRANHKRSKKEDDTMSIPCPLQFPISKTTLSLYDEVAGSSKRSKAHDCLVCGADFSSGQALGGHMRRHRGPPGGLDGGVRQDQAHNHDHHHGQYSSNQSSFSRLIGIKMGGGDRRYNVEGDKHLSLELDLNLPGTSTENESKKQFAVMKRKNPPPADGVYKLALAPPSLVDCHY